MCVEMLFAAVCQIRWTFRFFIVVHVKCDFCIVPCVEQPDPKIFRNSFTTSGEGMPERVRGPGFFSETLYRIVRFVLIIVRRMVHACMLWLCWQYIDD